MSTTIRFVNTKFTECVELCTALDKKCFPQEMWLDDHEILSLIEADAWATIVTYNGREIGLTVTITEAQAYSMLCNSDKRFTSNQNGAYSYSEAIDPQFQKRGIGQLLLKESQIFLAKQGFTTMSAHVRRKNGWDRTRQTVLSVVSNRSVPNFWPEWLKEPVMYQQAQL